MIPIRRTRSAPARRRQHKLSFPAARAAVILLSACLAVKALGSLGADAAAARLAEDLLRGGDLAGYVLSDTLPGGPARSGSLPLTALRQASPLLTASAAEAEPDADVPEAAAPSPAPDTAASPAIPSAGPEAAETPAASPSPSPAPAPAPAPDTAAVADDYDLDAEGIRIKNESVYDIDVPGLLAEGYDLQSCGGGAVLIIHTHGSEAYLPDGDDQYVPSDPYRTEDTEYNVVRVGDELAAALESRGLTVIHDRALYDYPSYTGSYGRALTAIEERLAENPEIRLVIDVHRDAFEEVDGVVYKTDADLGGEPCSQVMLVMGSDSSGLEHPLWRENLKFALHLQAAMNGKYPGLARPVMISEYRYNQHMTTGSLILEVGTNGNTLQESLAAVRYFADAACDVLLPILAPEG